MYQLLWESDSVLRLADQATIPPDPANADWIEYQAWLDAGNTPLPAEVPPIEYAGRIAVSAQVETTDDTPTEIYRVVCEPNHIYAATLSFLGTDPAVAVYEVSYRYVWKRLAAGAVTVGEAPITAIPDSAVADWNVQMRVAGNDAIFEVIGERTGAGNWLVEGTIVVFAPGGL